ncbi:hypothetical protein D3C86_2213710 [compost metagenome]
MPTVMSILPYKIPVLRATLFAAFTIYSVLVSGWQHSHLFGVNSLAADANVGET